MSNNVYRILEYGCSNIHGTDGVNSCDFYEKSAYGFNRCEHCNPEDGWAYCWNGDAVSEFKKEAKNEN